MSCYLGWWVASRVLEDKMHAKLMFQLKSRTTGCLVELIELEEGQHAVGGVTISLQLVTWGNFVS